VASVWLPFLLFTFASFPYPFGRNSASEVFTLLVPAAALLPFVRSRWGFAVLPFAGLTNAFFWAAVTKSYPTSVAMLAPIAGSLLWLVPVGIRMLAKPNATADSPEAKNA
jgi:hypothetical protein